VFEDANTVLAGTKANDTHQDERTITSKKLPCLKNLRKELRALATYYDQEIAENPAPETILKKQKTLT
jgi:hypothetical protein